MKILYIPDRANINQKPKMEENGYDLESHSIKGNGKGVSVQMNGSFNVITVKKIPLATCRKCVVKMVDQK